MDSDKAQRESFALGREIVILDDSTDDENNDEDFVTAEVKKSSALIVHSAAVAAAVGDYSEIETVRQKEEVHFEEIDSVADNEFGDKLENFPKKQGHPADGKKEIIGSETFRNCNGRSDDEIDDDDLLLQFGPIFGGCSVDGSDEVRVGGNQGRSRKSQATFSSSTSLLLKEVKMRHETSRRTGSKHSLSMSEYSANSTSDEKDVDKLRKEIQKPSKIAPREEARRAKQLEKERVKQAKQEERARKAEERRKVAQREKAEKDQRVRKERQEKGKFAEMEIAMVMESTLASSDLGNYIEKAVGEKYKVISFGKDGIDGSVIDGVVRWCRRDYVTGGAPDSVSDCIQQQSMEHCVEWMDLVTVIFHRPRDFLSLLSRDKSAAHNNDFPLLREWVRKIRNAAQNTGNTTSYTKIIRGEEGSSLCRYKQDLRVVLVLHKVQEELRSMWNNGGRRRTSFEPTNEEELQDAIIWMLLEERIECELTSSPEETSDFLTSMTRALSELPYVEKVTELHCVKKLKSDKEAVEPFDRARDCWKRMIQQVPGISDAMAVKMVRQYPTARSLMDEYRDPNLTEEQKRTLVASCLTDGKRNCVKVSDCVYRVMTGNDPLELV